MADSRFTNVGVNVEIADLAGYLAGLQKLLDG